MLIKENETLSKQNRGTIYYCPIINELARISYRPILFILNFCPSLFSCDRLRQNLKHWCYIGSIHSLERI
ncbi:hypothetical protein JHK82_050749 [Glycine max]|uniref:Uncharacterized protein n=1 Tax=Glycine max TaxID=3847 RepID=K7MSZ0_SOYBN|nr:hypothetical protein JHK86_050617 [Glycine max]KAG5091971.1 hypothetical protein JHK82_050749 [Glycine max]KAG5095065.1 hypothetical protein JHK84_050653 [Glycine max]KAH1154924.1 hypothetical protein GYH30_050281 [Glycine max]